MMKRLFLAALLASAAAPVAAAQNGADLCHVYVVDVGKARKAREGYRDTGDPERDARALAAAQVVFPEFRAAVGEEVLTTKTYPFPGGRLFITASVYYTDESMRSAGGFDSVLLGVAVSERALDDALSAENNAVAELTLDGFDTARAKKYLRVGGRDYLVGVECRSGR